MSGVTAAKMGFDKVITIWLKEVVAPDDKTAAETIKAFLTACFLPMHVKAATDHAEYEPDTGKVTLIEDLEGEEGVDGAESQETLVEGFFDLSIFDKEADVRKAEVPAGRYYDSDNNSVSRASLTTEAWRGKILGMQGGIRARGRARMELKKGASSPTEGGDDEVDAASPSFNSGQPPPHATTASDAGAREA